MEHESLEENNLLVSQLRKYAAYRTYYFSTVREPDIRWGFP